MKLKPITVDTSPSEEKVLLDTQTKALRLSSVSDIQNLGPHELIAMQSVLLHGSRLGIWETPEAWHPGSAPAVRCIDIVGRITSFLSQLLGVEGLQDVSRDVLFGRLLEDARLSTTRYLVLMRCGPASLRPMGVPVKPSNIAHIAYHYLPQASALSIVKAIKGDDDPASLSNHTVVHFSRLIDSDLRALEPVPGRQRILCQELGRMRYLAMRMLWGDAPLQSQIIEPVNGEVHATHVRDVKKTEVKAPPETQPHLPYPDDWVSQMGMKSAWLIDEVGTSVIRCLLGIKFIWKEAVASNMSTSTVSRRCASYLHNFKWLDSTGAEIRESDIPIPSWRSELLSNDENESFVWPPRNLEALTVLASALQGAHMFVVGMATAPRTSETITLNRDCVVRRTDGKAYQNGRTFKLVRTIDGEKRDWVLPDLAEKAVSQQAELVSVYEKISPINKLVDPDRMVHGTLLWGRIGLHTPRSEAMDSWGPNELLRNYAELLGLDMLPGGQPIRYHRFRKTVARIAALALTNAPKILKDVFGHKSIEMTMYYILTDKALASDIDTVARELRVLRCVDLIGDIVKREKAREVLLKASGNRFIAEAGLTSLGGPAASRLERAIRLAREEVHMRGEDWSAENTLELAKRFTMEGRFWELVRPGVLCIKSADQIGGCTKKKGATDASNCKTDCDHHLETHWRHTDVDRCIEQAVEFYEKEVSNGQDLVAGLWAGQVRAHVRVFQDLEDKWSSHPTVVSILSVEES